MSSAANQANWKAWIATAFEVITVVAPTIVSIWLARKIANHFKNEDTERSKAATKALYKIWIKLGRPGTLPAIDEHEMMILSDMCFPEQINVSIDDIGGLRNIKETLWETILLPLQHPQLFNSATAFSANNSSSKANKRAGGRPSAASAMAKAGEGATAAATPAHNLLSIPLGVLFYGPPGTGKTLMAKAIAKECNATFIPVNFSTLENKWYGESQKIARAIFSLARKFAPSIIFIDEVDVFLSSRSSLDRSASSTIKGEFMAQWDGLVTDHSAPVLVLGATNRPFDIDAAFLRRMPRQILFDLPGLEERAAILTLLLRDIPLAGEPGALVAHVAAQTDEYSGSDLKELCKAAAMEPLREFTRRNRKHFAAANRIHTHNNAAGNSKAAARGGGESDDEDDGFVTDDDDSDPDATVPDSDATGGVSMSSSLARAVQGPGAAARPVQRRARRGARDMRLRAVTAADFTVALASVKATGAESMRHMKRFYKHQQAANGGYSPYANTNNINSSGAGAGASGLEEEDEDDGTVEALAEMFGLSGANNSTRNATAAAAAGSSAESADDGHDGEFAFTTPGAASPKTAAATTAMGDVTAEAAEVAAMARMFRPPPGAAAAMTRETVMLARLPLQQLQASAVQILRAIQLHKRAVAKSAESGHRGQQQM